MSGVDLMMAAAVLSAMEQVQQGRAAQSEAEVAAQAHEREAVLARQRAAARARKTRRAGSARAAAARVRLAGSGAGLEGTPVDVLGQIAADHELDAQDELHLGGVDAARRLTRASSARRRGAAARGRAEAAAGATLLRGFS